MKIIIDAYGGDNAPEAIIKGCVSALAERSGFDIVLVGKESGINAVLQGLTYNADRLTVVNAEEVIDCDEQPTDAIRKKPDSSIVRAVKLLGEDENAKAFVSAGSTGAVLTAAILLTKRVKGVARPALAPTFPTLAGGEVMLLDCGANVDCKPEYLRQFAVMGSVYMKEVMGVKDPRVALLSNGTEEKKGCALTKEAFALLKDCKEVNFVGNMEAREILSGDYDVVVADGFAGNIALKSIEGTVKCIFTALKREIKSSKKSMLGAMLMKKSFINLKNMLDYNKKGGAVLLGTEKVVVKAHGASGEEAFKNAVLQAYSAANMQINQKLAEKLTMAE
ncbi:MAG: phosphate acyltransferase PlsX [Clostridia bacterium]|nr:phosphate acyltransferase PlsX [Clostridia bacterium]